MGRFSPHFFLCRTIILSSRDVVGCGRLGGGGVWTQLNYFKPEYTVVYSQIKSNEDNQLHHGCLLSRLHYRFILWYHNVG